MQEAAFAITFPRGAEWAATGAVTLSPELRAGHTARPVRVQVVTGGHSFDPDFYELFVNRPDIVATVTGHPDTYGRNFGKQTDVLVLYDMVAEISEEKQRNLRSFLESGKGLVVLHHAIADFGSWRWWSEEVVGGKYLLQPEGGRPASTFKHDEDIYAEAAGQHPITRGLVPLHLRDETYKGMWISPNTRVLLKTGNPTSDGPVAWIGPYDKSRVVYIQLGHDRLAHRNPAYRELVRRAILWASGKL
jgi:type 1 glutamine amidotransferase